MLDRFVYRRDDEKAFPDESSAPFRASSCTSLGQKFEVAFLPAEPPAISRFYVRWPGGTKPEDGQGNDLVAAHRDLLLLRLTSLEELEVSPYIRCTQNHFVCVASSDPKPHLQLKQLPVCTIPVTIAPREEGDKETVLPRVFFPNTVGLIRKLPTGDPAGELFVVAQLAKVSRKPESHRKMEAEVCLLRSQVSSDDGDDKWKVRTLPIEHEDEHYDDLWYWSTDDVVTFNNHICWVDYYRGGMLLYDALKEKPTISYHRLEISNRPTGSNHCRTLSEMNRRLCVTQKTGKDGHVSPLLRFVDVSRSDEYLFGPFELGSGFTIKSSTLASVGSAWVNDVTITSQDLWALNTSHGLPHDLLMFPLVSIPNSDIVHFLVSWYAEEEKNKKVSVVTLHMSQKKVMAVARYITGREDADMIKEKTHLLQGFISSKFPMFFTLEPGELNNPWGKASGSGAR